MPTLDYANPLYTFDGSHLSYTATKDCYVVGTIGGSMGQNNKILSINNVGVSSSFNMGSNISQPMVSVFLKIKSGDVVALNAFDTAMQLHIFEPII